MESILYPEFLIRKQDALILEHFDLFAKLCDQLKNRDSSIEIFKTLIEVPVFAGLPELDRLFGLLKKVIFSKQSMMLAPDRIDKMSNTTMDSANLSYKFLPCEFDRASLIPVYKDLQSTIQEHMNACLKLQEAQKEMTTMYKRVSDNSPDVKGTHVYEAFRTLNIIRNKEQSFRETILLLSDKLTNVARAFVLNRILRGVKALEHVCQTENLSKKLLDELRLIDAHKMTTEIVEKCSVKYFFPNMKNNSKDDAPYQTYPDVRQYNNSATEEHVTMENKYRVALKSTKSQYNGQLALKKGKEIKQKLVSADGEIAFGWTRLFKGAPKSYGFYSVNTTIA